MKCSLVSVFDLPMLMVLPRMAEATFLCLRYEIAIILKPDKNVRKKWCQTGDWG